MKSKWNFLNQSPAAQLMAKLGCPTTYASEHNVLFVKLKGMNKDQRRAQTKAQRIARRIQRRV